MATQIDKFLELVIRSGLLDSSVLRDVYLGFDTRRNDADSLNQLCAHLIALKSLTPWQCEKLRQGKFKGFFLDGYCLLSRLSVDETTSTYLCKEVATGNRVAMAVTSPLLDPVKDGKIHYTIREIAEESQAGDDV
jgi:eukaryotic-like serine/threonine-protein kinase